MSLSEMERRLIYKTLDEVGWNKTQAAKILGISVRTLRNKLKEYGQLFPAGGHNLPPLREGVAKR